MAKPALIKVILKHFKENTHQFKNFGQSVADSFVEDPKLKNIVHSVRLRIKEDSHIVEKIKRKYSKTITLKNYHNKITDLVGVRVLHLHPKQFAKIHEYINKKIDDGDWFLFEDPKAYTWDPESEASFKKLGLPTHFKESYYTSIHYVIKPHKGSTVACEIQVRTLLEETWGEIDHLINYPEKTKFISCSEQLSVFARLVGTGQRLTEAIMTVHNDEVKKSAKRNNR